MLKRAYNVPNGYCLISEEEIDEWGELSIPGWRRAVVQVGPPCWIVIVMVVEPVSDPPALPAPACPRCLWSSKTGWVFPCPYSLIALRGLLKGIGPGSLSHPASIFPPLFPASACLKGWLPRAGRAPRPSPSPCSSLCMWWPGLGGLPRALCLASPGAPHSWRLSWPVFWCHLMARRPPAWGVWWPRLPGPFCCSPEHWPVVPSTVLLALGIALWQDCWILVLKKILLDFFFIDEWMHTFTWYWSMRFLLKYSCISLQHHPGDVSEPVLGLRGCSQPASLHVTGICCWIWPLDWPAC